MHYPTLVPFVMGVLSVVIVAGVLRPDIRRRSVAAVPDGVGDNHRHTGFARSRGIKPVDRARCR